MENTLLTTLMWKHADVYSPEQNYEPIIYCTINGKIGVFKNTKSFQHWKFLKDKYHIEWWCYQHYIIPKE